MTFNRFCSFSNMRIKCQHLYYANEAKTSEFCELSNIYLRFVVKAFVSQEFPGNFYLANGKKFVHTLLLSHFID